MWKTSVIYHTDKYCVYASIHIQIYFANKQESTKEHFTAANPTVPGKSNIRISFIVQVCVHIQRTGFCSQYKQIAQKKWTLQT